MQIAVMHTYLKSHIGCVATPAPAPRQLLVEGRLRATSTASPHSALPPAGAGCTPTSSSPARSKRWVHSRSVRSRPPPTTNSDRSSRKAWPPPPSSASRGSTTRRLPPPANARLAAPSTCSAASSSGAACLSVVVSAIVCRSHACVRAICVDKGVSAPVVWSGAGAPSRAAAKAGLVARAHARACRPAGLPACRPHGAGSIWRLPRESPRPGINRQGRAAAA